MYRKALPKVMLINKGPFGKIKSMVNIAVESDVKGMMKLSDIMTLALVHCMWGLFGHKHPLSKSKQLNKVILTIFTSWFMKWRAWTGTPTSEVWRSHSTGNPSISQEPWVPFQLTQQSRLHLDHYCPIWFNDNVGVCESGYWAWQQLLQLWLRDSSWWCLWIYWSVGL